jgi:hypothetical protein
LVGTQLGEEDPAFANLISAARERLRRPWTSAPFDSAAAKAALGNRYESVLNELFLSEQIGPTLASGTSGNPRQIKRFLNAMILRQRTAQARGFGDEVKLPVLAKLMLAERFLPHFFDQFAAAAASSSDGRCPDLALLEAISAEVKTDAGTEGPSTGDGVKSAPGTKADAQPKVQFRDWMSSPALRAWAQLHPAVGEVDLRPYLFVAKDRKDYFGSATVLGHLASVAEKLFGPKLSVQALESGLKKLAAPEAAQVFEAVRGRIIGGDTFDTEPAGAAGLAVVVRAHPTLQSNLLDFLENLPRQRLGPWVCGGWEGVIKDAEADQRFNRLLEAWAKDGSQILKGAARATLKTRQQRN